MKDVISVIKQRNNRMLPFKKCIFSAYLRYVQLFSNSITIQLMFIQRRYMKTILLMNITYLTHSDVFTTAHYIFLGSNYYCRPHISLLVQITKKLSKRVYGHLFQKYDNQILRNQTITFSILLPSIQLYL